MAIISPVDVPGEFEEAARSDASSTGSISVVDWGTAVVEEGGRVSVDEGCEVTTAGAATAVVVDGRTVVVVSAVVAVVVGLAVVVAGLAAVAVRLAVVTVRLTVVVVCWISSSSSSSWFLVVVVVGPPVVVVADTWHPGRPWPAGGLHVLPGWAVAGPTYTHPAIPIATATAIVAPNAMSHEPRDLFRI